MGDKQHRDILTALALEVHYLLFTPEKSGNAYSQKKEYCFLKCTRDKQKLLISSSNNTALNMPSVDNLQVKVSILVLKYGQKKEKKSNIQTIAYKVVTHMNL